jgi:hypothetical protein
LGLERDAVPGQLVLELGVAPAQQVELALGRCALLAVLGGEAGQRTHLPGPLPLDDVARVQALSAQQGALASLIGDPLVLLEDRQLVLRAEAAPLRFGRRVLVGHGSILSALVYKG